MNPASNSSRFTAVLAALSRSNFRNRFRLRPQEQAYLNAKGMATVEAHARRFIAERLAPAVISNDGQQTPMRGHPVFIAQHATATCCRQCIAQWHKIPAGHALSADEQDYIVQVLMHWISKQTASAKSAPPEQSLPLSSSTSQESTPCFASPQQFRLW